MGARAEQSTGHLCVGGVIFKAETNGACHTPLSDRHGFPFPVWLWRPRSLVMPRDLTLLSLATSPFCHHHKSDLDWSLGSSATRKGDQEGGARVPAKRAHATGAFGRWSGGGEEISRNQHLALENSTWRLGRGVLVAHPALVVVATGDKRNPWW